MSARSAAVDATVMNDDHHAVERLADGVGCCHKCRHVLVRGFRAPEASVERVEDYGNRPPVRELVANYLDQLGAVAYEIKRDGLEIEGSRRSFCIAKKPLSERLDARLDTALPLEGAINHRPGCYASAAVIPTERD